MWEICENIKKSVFFKSEYTMAKIIVIILINTEMKFLIIVASHYYITFTHNLNYQS